MTRNADIIWKIIKPIMDAGLALDVRSEYDVEALADEVLHLPEDSEEFWEAVDRHRITDRQDYPGAYFMTILGNPPGYAVVVGNAHQYKVSQWHEGGVHFLRVKDITGRTISTIESRKGIPFSQDKVKSWVREVVRLDWLNR